MRTAFIDADILLHRAVSFVDEEFDGEPMADWKQALQFFDHLHKKWAKEIGKFDDYYLVISDGANFRKGLYPDYKANRKNIVPHLAFKRLKEEVMERQDVIWETGIEADDLIGIRCSEDPQHTVAVSADKDFATVPCSLVIPTSHGRKKPIRQRFSEEEANMNWLRQAITGDVVDNYKGLPRYGPVKAEQIVPGPGSVEQLWPAVEAEFLKKGFTSDYAITMARLARILRAGEYNFETKEVKLWEPPSTS